MLIIDECARLALAQVGNSPCLSVSEVGVQSFEVFASMDIDNIPFEVTLSVDTLISPLTWEPCPCTGILTQLQPIH